MDKLTEEEITNKMNQLKLNKTSSNSKENEKITRLIEDMNNININSNDNKVGYTYDKKMELHKTDKDHPENPKRTLSIYNNLVEKNLLARLIEIPSNEINESEVLNVHSEKHIKLIESLQYKQVKTGGKKEDVLRNENDKARITIDDTYDNYATYNAIKLAAGSLLNCLNSLKEGKVDSAFAIIRPPGHHAFCELASGFCFYNNVAISVKYAMKNLGYKKIAIVDWDVHHGNGTQEIFYDDPNVLFISIHRFDKGVFYPHNKEGNYDRVGKGKGTGYTINIPWDTISGSESVIGDDEYFYAFENLVVPVLTEFNPELIFVSSGFDAAENDPLGKLNVTPLGYAYMTNALMSLGKKLIVTLEGGYNLDSLANCSESCVRALLGEKMPYRNMKCKLTFDEVKLSMKPTNYAKELIDKVSQIFSAYWKCLKKSNISNTVLDVLNNSNIAIDLLNENKLNDIFKKLGVLEKQNDYLKFTIGKTLCPDDHECFLQKKRIAYRTRLEEREFYLSGVKVGKEYWDGFDRCFDLNYTEADLIHSIVISFFRNNDITANEVKSALLEFKDSISSNLKKVDILDSELIISYGILESSRTTKNSTHKVVEIKLTNMKDYSIVIDKTKDKRSVFLSGLDKLIEYFSEKSGVQKNKKSGGKKEKNNKENDDDSETQTQGEESTNF